MTSRTSSWTFWSNTPSTDYSVKSADDWIEARRQEDGTDGKLWRIYDGLYDLEKWIHKHPGGPQWLKITKVGIQLHCLIYLKAIINSLTSTYQSILIVLLLV